MLFFLDLFDKTWLRRGYYRQKPDILLLAGHIGRNDVCGKRFRRDPVAVWYTDGFVVCILVGTIDLNRQAQGRLQENLTIDRLESYIVDL